VTRWRRLRKAAFEKIRTALRSSQETSHRRTFPRRAVGEEQGQSDRADARIALQKPGQTGSRARLARTRPPKEPAILCDQRLASAAMYVLLIVRSTLQSGQDGFESGVVGAIHRNAPQDSTKARAERRFPEFLCVQSFMAPRLRSSGN